MADDQFDRLRLSLMQDVLPVGLAMFERVRQGGTKTLVEPFRSSKEPFQLLRVEGEESARIFRDRLDQISPGLGNPIVSVEVAVDNEESDAYQVLDNVLSRIDQRLDVLNSYLYDENHSVNKNQDEASTQDS